MIKVVASSVAHFEDIKSRLGQRGSIETMLIWKSAMSRRTMDWEHGIPDIESPEKWR